jgi:hypothetical protein
VGFGEVQALPKFFCIFYSRNMQIHASPDDFLARLEMRSSENSAKDFPPQVLIAYSYQHSDNMHKLTLKTVSFFKTK